LLGDFFLWGFLICGFFQSCLLGLRGLLRESLTIPFIGAGVMSDITSHRESMNECLRTRECGAIVAIGFVSETIVLPTSSTIIVRRFMNFVGHCFSFLFFIPCARGTNFCPQK
jgi:hypothetical protein